MVSEVARLMHIIESEYEAAQSGLNGLAQGTSQHQFITARMENMGRHMEELERIGGEDAVNLLLNTLGEPPQLQ